MPTRKTGWTVENELEAQGLFTSIQALGFIITLTSLHSFVVPEPDAPGHILLKGGIRAKVWMIFFATKSLFVWCAPLPVHG